MNSSLCGIVFDSSFSVALNSRHKFHFYFILNSQLQVMCLLVSKHFPEISRDQFWQTLMTKQCDITMTVKHCSIPIISRRCKQCQTSQPKLTIPFIYDKLFFRFKAFLRLLTHSLASISKVI